MKKITITEEQSDEVSYLISTITCAASKQSFIESVLLITYEYNNKDVMELNLVHNDFDQITGFYDAIDEYAQGISDILGTRFLLNNSHVKTYTNNRISYSERKAAKNAISSKILFDRNDIVRNVANHASNDLRTRPFSNLTEYEPPIELMYENKVLTLNKAKRMY